MNLRIKEGPFLALLAALFATIFYVYVWQPGGEFALQRISDFMYWALAAFAAAVGFIAFRKHVYQGPERRLLLMLSVATALDALAGLIYALQGFVYAEQPFPSYGDYIWMVFYATVVYTLLSALVQYRTFMRPGLTFLRGLTWGVLLFVLWKPVIVPTFTNEASSLGGVIALGYLLFSLVIVFLALTVFSALRSGLFGPAWTSFLLAYLCYAIADIAYGVLSAQGAYQTGNLIDLFLFLGHLSMAYGFYIHLGAGQPLRSGIVIETKRSRK